MDSAASATAQTPADAASLLRDLCLSAVRQIADECRRDVYGIGDGSSSGCREPVAVLLGRQAERILAENGSYACPASKNDGNDDHEDLVDRRLADLARFAHARFYAHSPGHLAPFWRQLYTDACILQVARRWLRLQRRRQGLGEGGPAFSPLHNRHPYPDLLDALVHPLDRALILAGGTGPVGRGPGWIHSVLEALHTLWRAEERRRRRQQAGDDDDDNDWSACPTFDDLAAAAVGPEPPPPPLFVPPVRYPVPRAAGPLGLEAFQAYLDASARKAEDGPQPLIVAGLLDDWPAMRRRRRRLGNNNDDDDNIPAHPWAVPAYLHWCTIGGRRLVPVEAGRSYVDAGWTQALVPFRVVLRELGANDGDKEEDDDDMENERKSLPRPLYLAQHGLLTQMPPLRRDLRVPDACYTTPPRVGGDDDDDGGGDTDPVVNAWLGPAGTITPLHTDPHHNLLAQAVGRKYVRLYAPQHGAELRPAAAAAPTQGAAAVDMSNTSRVDVGVMEGWDAAAGDGDEDGEGDDGHVFAALPFVDCILEPGETLYIPRGWWHYVRSVSVSFSVSFWWD